MARADLKIDSKIARELRQYTFEKHGTLHGKIKEEVEAAILKHIGRGE